MNEYIKKNSRGQEKKNCNEKYFSSESERNAGKKNKFEAKENEEFFMR